VTSTDFRPESNGFAFRNSFQFTDQQRAELLSTVALAVRPVLPLLGPFGIAARIAGVRDSLGRLALAAIPQQYGLCGGMAFAALDYYRAGLAMPRGIGPLDQPPLGSVLRLYLWQRLLDSWRLNGVSFLEWKARLCLLPKVWPFDAGPRALRNRSRSEWRTLRARLDAGEPTPLGLVGELSDPFLDHQVLAYGYEDADDARGTILVYDSNCPNAPQTITFDLRGETLVATESCERRRDNPLRGFFCESYEAAAPPQAH
jgi:hypothetical protein